MTSNDKVKFTKNTMWRIINICTVISKWYMESMDNYLQHEEEYFIILFSCTKLRLVCVNTHPLRENKLSKTAAKKYSTQLLPGLWAHTNITLHIQTPTSYYCHNNSNYQIYFMIADWFHFALHNGTNLTFGCKFHSIASIRDDCILLFIQGNKGMELNQEGSIDRSMVWGHDIINTIIG